MKLVNYGGRWRRIQSNAGTSESASSTESFKCMNVNRNLFDDLFSNTNQENEQNLLDFESISYQDLLIDWNGNQSVYSQSKCLQLDILSVRSPRKSPSGGSHSP